MHTHYIRVREDVWEPSGAVRVERREHGVEHGNVRDLVTSISLISIELCLDIVIIYFKNGDLFSVMRLMFWDEDQEAGNNAI